MPSISQSRELAMTKLQSGEWAYVPQPAAPPAIPAPSTAYPAAPNQYLRAPLPADMWEQPDGQRQFHASAIPQTRISPLSVGTDPIVGAQAASQAIQIVNSTPVRASGVTSVGLTMPGIFINPVSGSPVTSSGTLAVLLANESFNTVFAGPSSTQGSLALDTTASNSGVSSPASISGSTTQASNFALLLVEIDSSIGALTAAAPAGWTQISAIGTGGGNGGGVFWQSISNAGALLASSSYSFSSGAPKWGTSLITVKTSGGTPSIRQSQSANISGAGGPNGSDTLAFAGNTLAGSTLFLIIQGNIGVLSPITYQVTDSQSNNYTLVSSQTFAGQTAGQQCEQLIYSAPSSLAAACTITIKNPTTGNGGPGLVFYSLEVPNLASPVLTPIFRRLVLADLPGFSSSGILQPGSGGTGANLSATGGTHQFLSQASAGSAITVVQPDFSDLAGVSKPTKYNNITLVSNGLPSEYATVDLTARSAAIAATTLYTPISTGMFRISAYLKVTTVDATSSTLGAVTITYTDGTDSVAQSNVMHMADQTGAGVTSNSGNTTTSLLTGSMIIFATVGVAIKYAVAYASNIAGTMQYEIHLKLEAL